MLSDVKIRNVKASDRPIKLSDAGGLHLLIQPHGSKLWRQSYRHAGKQKTLALGIYPAVGLKDAREQRDAAKQLLAKGIDPSAQRKHAKLASGDNTFRAIANELVAKHEAEGKALATLAKHRWLLDDLACPYIGDRPIAEITAPELLSILRKVEARKQYETAKRLRSLCSMVFRYAIATGRAERDPASDLRGALIAPKVTHHAAITDPAKIGELLRAIDGYTGDPVTRAALQLAALLFVRPGELRHAEFAEFSLETAEWRIPAAKMKMKAEHRVPLTQQAIAIIKDLQSISGHGGKYIFASLRTPLRPMSENTLNAALRRLGYRHDEHTAHGFRTMASTRLNEMGFSPDAIEKQLAHQERDHVRGAYNAAQYWPERVTMMQRWADYLDERRLQSNILDIKSPTPQAA